MEKYDFIFKYEILKNSVLSDIEWKKPHSKIVQKDLLFHSETPK